MHGRASIKNLSAILKFFHIASGLKVNFMKSRLFGVGISLFDEQDMARIHGCKGVPVGANMGLKKHWKPIVDKFRSRLSDWKANLLSLGGRVTFIKSVLNSLPTNYISLFKTPKKRYDVISFGEDVSWKTKDTLGILVKSYCFNCEWWFGSFDPKSTKLLD
uniref:Reverse transcriptase zinc-binding domain-containing protein n=1 Tax=Lactuca sativa TaxID=4236 RepID=A0A9R1VM18_LACSA|nr:hypothetical protein LSAT_V11C500292240 [Lactuca sativa]